MIDLKDRPDLGWNTLFVVSLVGILIAVWFGFVAPVKAMPSTLGVHLGEQQVSRQRDAIHSQLEHILISRETWTGSEEMLGSSVLDALSGLAEKHSVQLTALRTDKANVVSNLSEVPFIVTVEGQFPDVVSFTNAVEDPSSKLAVNMIQFSASDTSPGRVTATFGLLGFLYKEAK